MWARCGTASTVWVGAQKKSRHAAEQERADIAAARIAWRAAQPRLNPARLVFLDESGFSTNMARRQGRSPRGQRLVAAVPHGHWETSTLVAGLRVDGIVAPLVIDHPMNGVTFRAYVEQHLAPTLAPGDIVVCDNLQSHKSPGVRAAINARGAELRHLPPYSPDMNPIGQVFAKLKALVRVRHHRPEPRRLRPQRVRQLPRQFRISTVGVKKLCWRRAPREREAERMPFDGSAFHVPRPEAWPPLPLTWRVSPRPWAKWTRPLACEDTWVQGHYSGDGSYCAVGALLETGGRKHASWLREATSQLLLVARQRGFRSIADMNDRSAHAAVLAAFDAAVAFARGDVA